jgi:hypothetical protein
VLFRSGAIAPTREVDRDHVTVEERQQQVPALLAEPTPVDEHHGHRGEILGERRGI